MTIKELEEFRMICQRGSLARASKELFMSPQGLSRVLKNLENELECTLLDRVGLLIISFGYLIFCVHKSQCNCEINWEVKSSGPAI